MNSIRLRTAALVAVGITVLLVQSGIALMLVIRAALTSQFDAALAARAEALRSLTRFDGVKVEMDFASEAMPRFAWDARPGRHSEVTEYFVAWVSEGESWRVLERSESLRGRDWPGMTREERGAGTRDVTLPDGGVGRAVVAEFAPTAEHDEEAERGGEVAPAIARGVSALAPVSAPRARILVAMSLASLDRTLAAVGWSIVGVGLTLALLSLLVVRWAVGRGLRPLSEMSRRVQALGPHSLAERFENGLLPTELRPIAEQLSALLVRLDEAFERERRFSAAASHELRTPIAELRMLLEVARSRPRSGQEWHDTSGRALGVLERAQALCETLFRLSRAEARPDPSRSTTAVDVGVALAESAARAVALHGGDERLVRVRCEHGLNAWADPAAISIVLANLLDNALTHGAATADDPVIVDASAEAGRVRIDVANPAPGLGQDDLPRLFEPFWRKDDSRHDGRGFGLGLSVARALARAGGGEIHARLDATPRLVLSVDLPVAR